MGKKTSILNITVEELKSLLKEGYLRAPQKKKHRYSKKEIKKAQQAKKLADEVRSGSSHMDGFGVVGTNTSTIQSDTAAVNNKTAEEYLKKLRAMNESNNVPAPAQSTDMVEIMIPNLKK